MGHLINPISFRLSINSFWNSNWVLLNNFNYINVFKKDYLLFDYFNWWFNRSEVWTKNFLYSNYKIYRIYKKIIVNIYYYDANTQVISDKNSQFFVLMFRLYLKRIWIPKTGKNFRNKFVTRNSWNKICNFFREGFLSLELLSFKNQLKFFLPLNVLNRNNNLDDIFFNLYSMDVLNISVDAIINYIGFRLQRKYSLNWVLRPVLKDLNAKIRRKRLLGYKILCSGRFTRKQIATYQWSRKGAVQHSTISSLVKYSEIRVRFKFGVGGIKLWLGYGNNVYDLVKRKVFLNAINYSPFKYSIKRHLVGNNNYLILHLNYWFFFFLRIMFFKNKNFDFYKKFVNIKVTKLLHFLFQNQIKEVPIVCCNTEPSLNLSLKIKNKYNVYKDSFFFFRRYYSKNINLFAKKKLRQLEIDYYNYEMQMQKAKYLETSNLITYFFSLLLIKNTKLLIFMKQKRPNYFLNLNREKNRFNLNVKLLKKFTI